jgi:hypothetical protein
VKAGSGQALLELALCAPVVVLLAVGVAAVVEVSSAGEGLDAATRAAASVASRAPDPVTAVNAARSRFAAVTAGYPLQEATLQIAFGTFSRATDATLTSQAYVDLGWAGLVFPGRLAMRSHAVVHLELWRTHRTAA